ncbi:unnamed protein product [Symbiodinium natans]|uniref:Uncharacterized protein n=1 Tax=Symbiodinium natans TaxID=878477 RepID=A0A812PT59_9DINO|nr:unnamed protein product [Symbiodinium natans]
MCFRKPFHMLPRPQSCAVSRARSRAYFGSHRENSENDAAHGFIWTLSGSVRLCQALSGYAKKSKRLRFVHGHGMGASLSLLREASFQFLRRRAASAQNWL